MKKLTLGVLNFMPNASQYLATIDLALARERHLIEIVPIRLTSHAYRSSGPDVASYAVFDELMQRRPPDMLLVAGAPVEHLPWHEIRYIDELNHIFAQAQQRIGAVMGLCFGGLALAKFLGVEKRVLSDKLFGVHTMQASPGARPWVGPGRSEFELPLSTWALLEESQLAHARGGPLRTLAQHPQLGSLLLASPGEQCLIMLGHPEYTVQTLYQEWQRDLGRHIGYTQHFCETSFVAMEQRLQQGASPILSNWVRSYLARASMAA